MPSAGQRFLKGLIKGGRGVTKAWVNALIAEDERKKEEKEAERQKRIDALNRRNIESQIATRELEPEPDIPTFKFETPEGLNISGKSGEEMDKLLERFGIKPPKETRKEDVTGIGEVKGVIAGRQKKTETARKEAAKAMIRELSAHPELAEFNFSKFEGRPPETIVESARGVVEPTIKEGGFLGIGKKEVPNPQLAIIEEILSGIQIPPTFETPVGEAATALFDSTEVARTDPALAAELLRFQPGAKGTQPKGKVPTVRELTDMLKEQKAAGLKIEWDKIAKDFPAIDIEKLKESVGE